MALAVAWVFLVEDYRPFVRRSEREDREAAYWAQRLEALEREASKDDVS